MTQLLMVRGEKDGARLKALLSWFILQVSWKRTKKMPLKGKNENEHLSNPLLKCFERAVQAMLLWHKPKHMSKSLPTSKITRHPLYSLEGFISSCRLSITQPHTHTHTNIPHWFGTPLDSVLTFSTVSKSLSNVGLKWGYNLVKV